MVRILEEGPLYINSHPGHQAVCAVLPNIVPLSSSELLCFYRLGEAFYSHDGTIAKLRSTDGGALWIEDGPVWERRRDKVPYTYSAPHGTRLKDGSLVLVAHRYRATAEERFRFNPETGGMKPAEPILFRSNDAGRTWSEPEVLELGREGVIDTPSSIIELNDGGWFLGSEVWKPWDDASPLHIKGFGLISRDEGKTWGERVDFPSALDPGKMYSHSRYTRMLDGRICALQWTQSIGGDTNFDLHLVISDESGLKWSTPRPTGINAQTSWVADLGEDRLAAAFVDREGESPGVRVALSPDMGATWDLENSVLVWDAVGQEFLGVSQKPAYPASHANIAFGKPHLTRLSDGNLMASWWCTQACVTHIRFCRLTAD